MSRLIHIPIIDDDEEKPDQCMLDINLEPPTPFEAGATLQFRQVAPSTSNTLSAHHQSTYASPHSDHTFAWQDSPSQESTSMSRPNSTSGWSRSGTSVSGDDSLFAASDNSDSRANTPSKAGKSKSHARKRAPGHVSRPRNAFILFRSHAITNKIIPPSLGVKDNRAVSCIVATLWKSLPEDERQQWKSEAEKEKELHRQQYPNYQFKPGTAGTKGKMRTHAKTEETVKEQCEIIADQILRAHGRSPTREEGEVKRKKQQQQLQAAIKKSSRNKDGLPRARKGGSFRTRQLTEDNAATPETSEGNIEIKEEEDDVAEDYVPPDLASSRRRSSSLPGSNESLKRHEASIDMFASWQARIEQPPALQQEISNETIDFTQPWQPSLANRRCVNPAALRFAVPSSFGDVSFASPRTITSGMSILAPSPRYALFGVNDRQTLASPTSTRRPDEIQTADAMLLSPIKSSFYDIRPGNTGWQSWSRYSYADIALPVMKPRQQSIDSNSSRRNSLLLHRPSQGLFLQDINDTIYPSQADTPTTATTNTAHISLHHNFFSPTMQSFHQRYTDLKSHAEDVIIDEERPDPLPQAHPPFTRIKPNHPTSTLADADTTPSFNRLALHDPSSL